MKPKLIMVLALALALIDYFVPFYFLKDLESFLGNYLFWSVLSLLTVIFGIIVTRNWRKEND